MMIDDMTPVVLRKHPDGRCELVDRRKERGVKTVQWLPVGEPVPEGWKLCNERQSHHSRHARLIEPA